MAASADDAFKGIRLAFRTSDVYFFIRIHKEHFKDMTTFNAPEFKNRHCFAPGLSSMFLAI
jgi:hypothetical protein